MPKTERAIRSNSNVLTFLGVLVSCLFFQSDLNAQCGTMICNNVLQISMDENCEILFTPDLLLEGDPTKQGTSFTLTIADLGINNQALDLTESVPIGTYQYKVSNQCGNSCWGSFFAEDNNVLSNTSYPCGVEAEEIDIQGALEIKTGELSASIVVPYIVNACQTLTFGDVAVRTIQYECADGPDGIPGNADDGWCNAMVQISYSDDPGTGMVTIDATLDVALDEDITCDYSIYAAACFDDSCVFSCFELDSMFNNADYTAHLIPEFQNCFSNLEIEYEDELIVDHQNCGDKTIKREWFGIGSKHGNLERRVIATQYFTFEPVDLDEVWMPTQTITVPCHISEHPDSIAAFLDDSATCENEGIPFAYPHIEGTPITCDECAPIEIHFKKLKELKEDVPLLVTGPDGEDQWVLIDQWVKETDSRLVCGCDEWNQLESEVKDEYSAIGDIIDITSIFPGLLDADGKCSTWPTTSQWPNLVDAWTGSGTYVFTGSGTMTSLNHIPLYGDNQQTCNLVTDKEDVIIPICGTGDYVSSYKVIRTWTVYDWCTGTNRKSVQVIKVEDLEGPTFVVQDSISLSTDPWLCGVNYEVPPPSELDDKCSPHHISYTVHLDGSPGLQITGNTEDGYTILDIPKGDQRLIYTVSDNCGNSTQDTTVLWIKDNIPPVAIAKENIVVSLTSSGNSAGYAKVFYNSIDNGSYDICSPKVKIEIRREKDLCGILGNDTYTSGRNRGDLNYGLHPDSTGLVDHDDGQFIKFCCEDLTEGGYGIHKVWMRVWDDANMDGVIGNAGDNYNEVWANVRVEDKLNVILTCPPDITVSCYIGLDSLSVLGIPETRGACTPNIKYEDELPSTHCPTGEVIRKWYVDKNIDHGFDIGEKFCKQIINVTDPRPMFCHDIIFPRDTIVDCASAEMDSAPVWTEDHCGLFGFSEKVDIFDLQDEYCYKIVKQFTVIDWCQYNPNSGSNVGICYGTQKITVVDNAAPTFASCEDKIVESADAECVVTDFSISQTAIDEGDCLDKKLTWTICLDLGSNRSCDYTYHAISQSGEELVVDLLDEDGAPLTMIAGEHSVTWTVTDACDNESSCTTQLIVADTKAPTPICIEAISTAVMSNSGTVEIWATDFDPDKKSFDNCDKSLTYSFSGEEIITNLTIGCRPSPGNENCGDCKQTVEFPLDTEIPDEVTEIVAGGEVLELDYPYDLTDPFDQQRLLDDCIALGYDVEGRIDDATQNLVVCINYAGVEFEAVNVNNGESYSFTCTDCRGSIENGLFIENGRSQIFELPMWVWDDGYDADCDGRITSDERNKDWCMVMLRVDDNVGICRDETEDESAAMIAGDIQTDQGAMIESVEVVIESMHPEHPTMAITQSNGVYAFMDNPMELDYEISAARDDDHINGVSTLDLVLIQKHILGLKILDSPYKIIASDINNDGSISAGDLVELRKLILGIYAELPNNSSWRFVEEAQEFQNPYSPFPYVENIEILDLSNDMLAQDFIGVKIGDVNNNVRANSLIASEVRTNSKVVLRTDQQSVEKGERIEVEFSSEDFESVYGMQFSMRHAGLRLVDITSGAIELSEENIGIIKEDALLSFSWGEINPVSSDEVLFSLTFEALASVELSETMNITSQVTDAEAYTTDSYVLNDVTLQFNYSTEVQDFVLYQNEPNPFSTKTEIGFSLPESSDVTLKIFDVNGKLVLQRSGSYPKGLNIIELNSDDLSSAGILYYQLDAGKYNATKKMVMIN